MTDGSHLVHIRKYKFDKLEVVDCFAKHLFVGVGREKLVDSVKDCPGREIVMIVRIMKDQDHLLLPSTMFSSVLRTLSKSCLRESLRSSMAGKIRERKITTWTEESG